jgi:hypothetical protein
MEVFFPWVLWLQTTLAAGSEAEREKTNKREGETKRRSSRVKKSFWGRKKNFFDALYRFFRSLHVFSFSFFALIFTLIFTLLFCRLYVELDIHGSFFRLLLWLRTTREKKGDTEWKRFWGRKKKTFVYTTGNFIFSLAQIQSVAWNDLIKRSEQLINSTQ